MNHWAFVGAAYAITFIASAGVTAWAWLSMRKAEADAEALGKRR